jgi:hypothetical protein
VGVDDARDAAMGGGVAALAGGAAVGHARVTDAALVGAAAVDALQGGGAAVLRRGAAVVGGGAGDAASRGGVAHAQAELVARAVVVARAARGRNVGGGDIDDRDVDRRVDHGCVERGGVEGHGGVGAAHDGLVLGAGRERQQDREASRVLHLGDWRVLRAVVSSAAVERTRGVEPFARCVVGAS